MQTGSGVQPASYSVSTRLFTMAWSWLLTSIPCRC